MTDYIILEMYIFIKLQFVFDTSIKSVAASREPGIFLIHIDNLQT